MHFQQTCIKTFNRNDFKKKKTVVKENMFMMMFANMYIKVIYIQVHTIIIYITNTITKLKMYKRLYGIYYAYVINDL